MAETPQAGPESSLPAPAPEDPSAESEGGAGRQTCRHGTPRGSGDPRHPSPRRLARFAEAGVALALLLLMLAGTLATRHPPSGASDFLTVDNLLSVALAFSWIAIMAVGQMLVIISGGIDLSVGATLALSGTLAAVLLTRSAAPWPVAVVAALAAGATVGVVNALLIVRAGLPPFIATLGMMCIARAGALRLSQGHPISGLPEAFKLAAGSGHLLGVRVPILVMVAVMLLGAWLLSQTRWGTYAYAIGGNEEAARFAGVRVPRIKVLLYALCGLCCGIAAMVMTASVGVAEPTAGRGWELDVIAAAVIGGGSLSGGYGSALGALLGAAMMGVIRNLLVLLGVEHYWHDGVIGAVIILAVALDQLRKRRLR